MTQEKFVGSCVPRAPLRFWDGLRWGCRGAAAPLRCLSGLVAAGVCTCNTSLAPNSVQGMWSSHQLAGAPQVPGGSTQWRSAAAKLQLQHQLGPLSSSARSHCAGKQACAKWREQVRRDCAKQQSGQHDQHRMR